MQDSKLICSVVIPVYNAEKFIEQTLNSVINQTIKDIEIICVDDCSTDSSVNIIKNMQNNDDRIVLLQNEENLKVSKTRMKGVNFAHADWIAFLDSDDRWLPNHLEKVIEVRDKNNAKLVSSSSKFIDNDGNNLQGDFIIPSEITYKMLLKQNKILCSSMLVEKKLIQKYPFYADAMHEDYVCVLSILKEIGKSYGVTEPTVVYRLTKGSKSRNKFKAIKMSYHTYREHGLNFFQSLYYTFWNGINGIKKYSKIK